MQRNRNSATISKTMAVGATSESEGSRINEEEMEVRAFKYLGWWFDRSIQRNEKMKEKAEEWAGKMSRKDGWREADWCGNSWRDQV